MELKLLLRRRTRRGRQGLYKNLLNISVIISSSCSAAAIFSAKVGWGLPNPRNDIAVVVIGDWGLGKVLLLLLVCWFGDYGDGELNEALEGG